MIGKIVPFDNGFRIKVRLLPFVPVYIDPGYPTYLSEQAAKVVAATAGINLKP